MERYLLENIKKDLSKKMVFLGGPRQVGKTTLARSLITDQNSYLNWDIPKDRDLILRRALPNTETIIFDELHKFKQWRNYLKGIFDEYGKGKKILVTGSARLDFYRYNGDSLQGRYHFLRLHPLSFREIGGKSLDDMKSLLKFGGFPEPFLSASESESRRWSLEYRSRLLREEITSIEQIKDISLLELLVIRLPELVGSPLSLNALREDLQINHGTVSRWVDVLERFYAIFRLNPFGSPKIKAVKKERKHYHFDWTVVENEGPKFENFIACHLLKWCHYQYDTEGREIDLCYFRDVNNREVDFVITEKRKPIMAIECKSSDRDLSSSLKYFKAIFPSVTAVQVSLLSEKDFVTKEGIRITSASKLLSELI